MKLKDLVEDTQSKKEIEVLLNLMHIRNNYTINSDLTVDVKGSVVIPSSFSTTPLQFRTVTGDYNVAHLITLESLKGSPKNVGGDFNCQGTKIKSLEGGPERVGGGMNCSNTKMGSLVGAPTYVGEQFDCSNTLIESLEGAPSYIGGDLYCGRTKIRSLQNIHKQIKHIGGIFQIVDTVNSHVLGVMFIKGLKWIQFYNGTGGQSVVQAIINKHLAGDRNVHDAQEELIEAGFKEYAKL